MVPPSLSAPPQVSSLVEPPMAAMLELCKLSGFHRVAYAPSRNRQWVVATVAERKDARSLTLRRVFLRGVVRGRGGRSRAAWR